MNQQSKLTMWQIQANTQTLPTEVKIQNANSRHACLSHPSCTQGLLITSVEYFRWQLYYQFNYPTGQTDNLNM